MNFEVKLAAEVYQYVDLGKSADKRIFKWVFKIIKRWSLFHFFHLIILSPNWVKDDDLICCMSHVLLWRDVCQRRRISMLYARADIKSLHQIFVLIYLI